MLRLTIRCSLATCIREQSRPSLQGRAYMHIPDHQVLQARSLWPLCYGNLFLTLRRRHAFCISGCMNSGSASTEPL